MSAVCGWNFTVEEMLLAGERIQTLRHAFNVREGSRPADFKLSDRMVDVLLGQGKKLAEVVKTPGVTEVIYYRRHQESGGMTAAQAKRLEGNF